MRDFGAGEGFGTPYGFHDRTGTQAWAHPPEVPPFPQADLPGYGGHAGHGDLLDPSWDPAEELASLLQDAIAAERNTLPPARRPEDEGRPPDHAPLARLTQIPADLEPVPRAAGPGHRRTRRIAIGWVSAASCSIAAVTAVLVPVVSVFGGAITYGPLRHVAEPRTPAHAADWWPLLVYGPWLVASLSILRAAVHQRRATHSWVVVLLFSLTAMLLCVAQAPRTFVDAAAAALPTAASVACFHQLVRLVTLTRPPRRPAHSRRVLRPAARHGGQVTPFAGTAHLPRQPSGRDRVL
ncbi:DUF2637 domain-containing protein [Streptomyces sp. MRC013]|uniref:DUF2637 domain-containing protein n=1 Tax=Streptomyces sp. MRC013 TaxID=2898276 RepID=UPI002026984E|nr:DUF2637 domain-containing protein [Streptomyces sp. MRC013]URM88881.1 DUF2637 domain-containing protein [Streptomyces sp. MRC013]